VNHVIHIAYYVITQVEGYYTFVIIRNRINMHKAAEP